MPHALPDREVFVGVDTHADLHHAAVVDRNGREIADQAFATTPAGYQELCRWLTRHGQLVTVGVEGTGSYGAALTRVLTAAGLTVVEVDRPDRSARRRQGKSDPLDAYAAARAAASGRASGTPKARNGLVESLRLVKLARTSAVKTRTQTMNQIHQVLITGPADLREQFRRVKGAKLIKALTRLRPSRDLTDPAAASKYTLRQLARRAQDLADEITEHDQHLTALTEQAAPALLELPGVGVQSASQLLISAGDNPGRLQSEAAFAHLTGVAPVPASSGRTDRHRLNRGGDRQANKALWDIARTRRRYDPRTQDYIARRQREDHLSDKEVLRCIKRYIAREIYRILTQPATQQATPAAT